MERVFSPNEIILEKVQLALAIKSIDGKQQHIGVIYRDISNDLKFLHLAFHKDLRNEEAKMSYLWIDPVINSIRANNVAAICRQVWSGNQSRIPYGFSFPNDCFDTETGKFIGSTKLGLTCATFVLAIFQRAGLQVIDYSTWPERPDDKDWQEFIITALEKSATTSEHINLVRTEVGALRFRPEEVGAAVTFKKMPTAFNEVLPVSRQLLERLHTKFNSTSN